MHRVTVSCGGQRRTLHLHRGDTVCLGAATDNDLVAPFPGVSRHHARLEGTPDGVLVVDLGSKNGLVCEGRRFENLLLDGERRVRLGYALLEVEEASSSDLSLGLRVDCADPASAAETPSQETRELLEVDDSTAPAAALRLVRRLGSRRRDATGGGREEHGEVLGRARTVLGAAWLAAVRLEADGELTTLTWIGPLAEPDTLSQVEATLATAGGRRAEVHRLELTDHFVLAVPRASSGATSRERGGTGPQESGEWGGTVGRHWLVTAFEDGQRPGAWAEELLGFLADRVLPDAPAPSTPSTPGESLPAVEPLRFPDTMVVGSSPAMTEFLQQLRSTVASDLNVLLTGETGVGKELVAQVIHRSGPQADGPFLAINCAAIPGELLEAQLFGVAARVATGVDPRPGLFVGADGGCLFLDEIGELPERLQAKLLRVLQEREVWPVGSGKPRRVDVRVIAASNRDLEAEMRAGRFRSDLYYRLRGLHFHVPPLRHRTEDLPELIHHLVRRAAEKTGKRISGVTRRALDRLLDHPWPGNVRELIHEVERAVLLGPDGGALDLEHFPGLGESQPVAPPSAAESTPRDGEAAAEATGGDEPTGDTAEFRPLQERLDEVERRAIRQALAASGGVKARAAELLGITRNGLNLKLKRLEIEPD